MNFQSFSFLAFFLLSSAATILAARRSRRAAEWCLLLCSFGAYFYVQPLAALLLLFGSFVTFCAARFVEWSPHRRRVYLAAIGYHLAVLVWFKYLNFFLATASRQTVEHSFIPLGISFFTFQQIWYLKECYEGTFRRVGSRRFALVSFFYPTITSGPILRPESVLPQLDGAAFHPSWDDVGAGMYAIAMGLGKKVLLADRMAEFIDKGWLYLSDLTVAEAWCVILGYTLQLYFDFSGYCDIATGFARCLGIRLPKNFDSPYRARSINEFWKRWHITLTTFLRECVYFPLGGNRKGTARTYVNLCVVFLISGIWHGAGWTYLVWGLLHGACMVFERVVTEERLAKIPTLLRRVGTFGVVSVLWVFFRAPSIGAAMQMLKTACALPRTLPANWLGATVFETEQKALTHLVPSLAEQSGTMVLVALLAVGLIVTQMPHNTQRRVEHFYPTWQKAALTAVVLTLSLLSFGGVSSFLYVNF